MASDFGKIAIDVSKDKGYDLAKLGSMIREFETAVKGITDSSKVLSSNLKDLGESYRKEIYFPKGREKDIKNAFDALAKNRAGISDSSPISVSDIMDAPFDSQKVTIRSQRAVARARKLFLENSGYFEETTERDKYNVGVPSMESSVTSKRGATKSLFSAIMGDVRSIDREVTRKQDEQEAIKQAKKQEQIARQEAKKQEQTEKQEARSKIQEAKSIEKAKEKEEKDRENESKKNSISQLKMIGSLFAVYKAVKEVIEWVSKLYSLAVSAAKNAADATITGNQLGISPVNLVRYSYVDKAKGLKEGTITGAMGAIQTAFGDITNLDEEKLKKLAIVMGGGVSQMVQSGVGASDPEKFLKEIINTFVRRGLSGVNSLGQQVGQEQAIMNLSTYLGGIDSNMRAIFDKIIMDALNPLNPQVNAYKQNAWGMFTTQGVPTVSQPTNFDMATLKEANDTFNTFSSVMQQITDGLSRFFTIVFEPAVASFTDLFIKIFGTKEEKAVRKATIKEQNEAIASGFISAIGARKKVMTKSESDAYQAYLNTFFEKNADGTYDIKQTRGILGGSIDLIYQKGALEKFASLYKLSPEQLMQLAELQQLETNAAKAKELASSGTKLNTNSAPEVVLGRLPIMTLVKKTVQDMLAGTLDNVKVTQNIRGTVLNDMNDAGVRDALYENIAKMYNYGNAAQDDLISEIIRKGQTEQGGEITLNVTNDKIVFGFIPTDKKKKEEYRTVTIDTTVFSQSGN